ncbi:MAG: hypothetical protein KC422_13305 [Trueperaceae bacterium]|nr:hypothetical protein [Trueperaceae bacterium]
MKTQQEASYILKITHIQGEQKFLLQNIKSGERQWCQSWEELRNQLQINIRVKGLK